MIRKSFTKPHRASLALLLAPALFGQTTFLQDKFNDGSRTDLSPTTSAAWFTSSTANTVFTNGAGGANGTLALDNASSRTMVGYFTAAGAPVTMSVGDILTLDITFTIDGAPLDKSGGLIVGLLRSDANGAAITGTGFTAVGSPNTNGRFSGDYGSSNPSSHVFGNYVGYAAWTNLLGTANPISLRKRIATASPGTDGLNNASAAWPTLGSAGGTGSAPVTGAACHAILTLTRNAGGSMSVAYKLTQGSGTLVTQTLTEAVATTTSFDTVNVYLASATLTGGVAAHLTLQQVDITLSNPSLIVAPTITTPPADQTVIAGNGASFSVVATGTPSPTYQWQKNTVDIPGATSVTLALANVQPTNAGSYRVVVSNPGGTINSSPATLTVQTPPVIATPPASQSVLVGDNVSFAVLATGTAPFTYQWKKGTGDLVGQTADTLTLNAVSLAEAGDYSVVVTNVAGSTPSAPATLIVAAAAVAPSVTTPPVSQTVVLGAPASFSVVATGTAPLTYQWNKDTFAIPGATGSTLAFPAVAATDAASYTVTITNSVTSITSAAALLTVNLPPIIATPPAGATASIGSPVTFTVLAGGTAPFTYQWRKDGTPIGGATGSSFNIASVQPTDAGSYTVVVTNIVSFATSAAAVLAVNTPPAIAAQPAPQAATFGGAVTFTVGVSGTAPFAYQWSKDGNPISGATSATLALTNLQAGDIGSYAVVVTNPFGSAPSTGAALTLFASLPNSAYNLFGFATLGAGTTGGGVIPESDPAYVKVTTPLEFAAAIALSNKTVGAVKVIEIMNDLNLGWNEVGPAVQALASTPFRAHATPKLHPTLITTGVSVLDIKAKSGLTIFSANGATIKHVNFNVKGTANIIIRNLKFDEMWEWDESSKGNYDDNDWDFITLSNGGAATNIWIDHCTFTKAYDGITDLKAGTQYVTMSWCRYVGDDGATNSNSFVRQQVAALEANKSAYAFYNFLRTNGFSVEDIVTIIQGHDKGHLMGSNSLDSSNATLSATFHHQWFQNLWDRCVPRLRAGNVHDYNIYVDDVGVLAAKRLRDTRAAALSTSLRNTLNNTYSFNPPINGSISTESGALLVEKSVYSDCLWPLRNNQTAVTNPVYTGKIQALDTIYSFHNADGTTTIMRGNSTDAGNPMGPFQAPVIPFAWNFLPDAVPYAYTTDDPAQLPNVLAIGAGAGRLTWSKDNWLKTAYVDPVVAASITTSPVSQSVALGSPVCFTVAAAGTAPLSYQWYKDNILLPGETSATLSIASAQPANAGNYKATATNPYGSMGSDSATLTVTQTYAAWATANGLAPGQDGFTADSEADGIGNLLEYFLNLRPTISDPVGLPTGTLESGNFVFRFKHATTVTGVTSRVLTSSDLLAWSPAAVAPVLESAAAGTETYVVILPTTASRLFARLEVTSGVTVVATVPVGYLKNTVAGGAPAAPVTTVFGIPLDDTSAPVAGIRAGRIESFTATTLTQSLGGWTSSLAAPAAPWAVRLTSGPSAGKLLDVTANTATTLTVSGADLTTLGLTAGTDTFELLPLDTLGSLFGGATLLGGTTASTADNVQVRSGTSWLVYFYDTNLGFWRRTIGPATNGNNVLIRPATGVQIARRAPALTLTFAGRVPATAFRTAINNASTTVIHAGFPTDTTLGALAAQILLSGWRSAATAAAADTVSLFNGTAWIGYFHNGAFWQPATGAVVNSDATAILSGALLTIQRPGAAAGTTDFVRAVPY